MGLLILSTFPYIGSAHNKKIEGKKKKDQEGDIKDGRIIK